MSIYETLQRTKMDDLKSRNFFLDEGLVLRLVCDLDWRLLPTFLCLEGMFSLDEWRDGLRGFVEKGRGFVEKGTVFLRCSLTGEVCGLLYLLTLLAV